MVAHRQLQSPFSDSGGDFATQIANNVTVLYGLEKPFGYGVFSDYRACAEEQIDKCNFAALMFVFLGLGMGLSEYVCT